MNVRPLAAAVAVVALTASASLQTRAPGAADPAAAPDTGAYTVVPNWFSPIQAGSIDYAVEVFVENADRIFIGSTGTSPEPPEGTPLRLFNLSIPGAKLDHFLAIRDANGKLVDEWRQWYDRFKVPHKVTIDPYDPEKHIWFIDRGTQQIFKFTHDGKQLVMELGEKNVAADDEKHFNQPTDIAFLPDGTFFVSDGYGNARVLKYDKTGKLLKTWGTKGDGPGQFNLPHCVAVDARRRVYVADRSNHRIQVFDENGTFLEQWPNIPQPHHMMITEDQHMWISDGTANQMLEYDLSGKRLTSWGTQGPGSGFMNQPHSFGVDTAGVLYIANGLNHRVEKFLPKAGADKSALIGQPFGWAAAKR
jgi:peptidylamidoglycolate lyase